MVPIFIRFITGGEVKQSDLPTGYSVNSGRQRGEERSVEADQFSKNISYCCSKIRV